MKRLIIILFLSGILCADPALAMEHSALSNIFTLDTRDAPTSAGGLEHSALSNVFTLDTRVAPWDVNSDGVVDMLDILTVGNAFGTSVEGLAADVDGDGAVDIRDLVMVASHFGEKTMDTISGQ